MPPIPITAAIATESFSCNSWWRCASSVSRPTNFVAPLQGKLSGISVVGVNFVGSRSDEYSQKL
uniref:hypothetical protein n=1 Tax=Hassallia byssoidea TaxID=482630 RepID=UPI00191374F3|nr:hypothetical protein [Hassalia byssoidea]